MRTTVDIDEQLMISAIKASGARSKREAVEMGLRALLQLCAQRGARHLRGKIGWTGDLAAMRRDD
jgi:Arc/MetJ family transcription regulator